MIIERLLIPRGQLAMRLLMYSMYQKRDGGHLVIETNKCRYGVKSLDFWSISNMTFMSPYGR